jgi:hypothetical protein
MRRALVLAVTVVCGGNALAHVAPSENDNNRYLKLTPQGDRVRLAYTVFFGEVPGAQLRRELDTNKDGTISESEARAFGDKVAAEVAASIDLSVDKVQQKVAWTDVVVGMGSPSARAGSFSVDLVTQVCLTGGPTHAVLLRDRFRLTNPGETEVKLEDATGIVIRKAMVGTASDPSRLYKFVGPGGPLTDDGVDFQFEVTDKALPSASACTGPEPEKTGLPPLLIVGAAALLAFVLAMLLKVAAGRRA